MDEHCVVPQPRWMKQVGAELRSGTQSGSHSIHVCSVFIQCFRSFKDADFGVNILLFSFFGQ